MRLHLGGHHHFDIYKHAVQLDDFIGDGCSNGSCLSANVTNFYAFHQDLYYLYMNLPWLGLLGLLIGMAGLVANVFAMTILSRPAMKSPFTCCLIGLAIFDCVYVGIFMADSIALLTHNMHGAMIQLYLYFNFILFFSETASTWVTVAISAERCVVVCFPLWAKTALTCCRAKAAILLIAIGAVLFNLPRFWELQLLPGHMSEMEDTAVHVQSMVGDQFIKVDTSWVMLFALYVLPFAALSVLNVVIWLKIRHADRLLYRLTGVHRRDAVFALMGIGVVVVFLLCNSLACAVNILRIIGVDVRLQHPEVMSVTNFLTMANPLLNFIIYCLLGRSFRRIFCGILLPCFPESIRLRFGSDTELTGADS